MGRICHPEPSAQSASLNIGELETKILDFKGMKSVAIERVENGKLFGLTYSPKYRLATRSALL